MHEIAGHKTVENAMELCEFEFLYRGQGFFLFDL